MSLFKYLFISLLITVWTSAASADNRVIRHNCESDFDCIADSIKELKALGCELEMPNANSYREVSSCYAPYGAFSTSNCTSKPVQLVGGPKPTCPTGATWIRASRPSSSKAKFSGVCMMSRRSKTTRINHGNR